jgi:two-component system response regulator PilR (NtrC family)
MLAAVLLSEGHRVTSAGSGADALALLGREPVDLLITDLSMPGMDGVELLRRASAVAPDTPAIVITAFGSKETAVEAMRHGAVNYVEKPFDVEEMRLHARRALGQRALSNENRRLRARLTVNGELLGRSPAMKEVRDLVERVAPADCTVLITGESGTGKEVAARAIHHASGRSEKPLISVNCAAIPAELLESELFGHVRGAFTGADRSRAGLVEAAVGGTLFLDEIGDMPATMQAKLLRVLQEKKIRRVGGTEEIPVDVRVITATHRDLEALVREGAFREDLYYRINVIRVRMPALRERLEDLPEFVQLFAFRHAERMGRPAPAIEGPFLEALSRYGWPGNIRELENVVERAVTLGADRLSAAALPAEVAEAGRLAEGALCLPDRFDLEAYLDAQRRRIMLAALAATGGVQTRAAGRLGMTFRSFRYFAKKFGITTRGGAEGEDAAPGEAAAAEDFEPAGTVR